MTEKSKTPPPEPSKTERGPRPKRRIARVLVPVAGVALLGLLVAVQGGFFERDKVAPGRADAAGQGMPPDATEYVVREVEIPAVYRTVGTVRSRDEIDVSALIIARVISVEVRSSDVVRKDQVLVRLDGAAQESRVGQARERVAAAEAAISESEQRIASAQAALDLASKERDRMQQLVKDGVVAQRSLDEAVSGYRQALAALNQARDAERATRAQLEVARQALNEAQTALDYATVRSPLDGIVAERLVDPGDLADPGRVLVRVFDPERLRLEIPVRESLAGVISERTDVAFDVPALARTLTGRVEEIVPSVDPGSRTFLVKVEISKTGDLMPGMFGTVAIPLGRTEKTVRIPEAAVRRTGQLESVAQVVDGEVRRVFVRTAPAAGGMRNVLSGLSPGVTILTFPDRASE